MRSAALGRALVASGIANGRVQVASINADHARARAAMRPAQVASGNTSHVVRLALIQLAQAVSASTTRAVTPALIQLAQAASGDVVRVPVRAATAFMIAAETVVNGALATTPVKAASSATTVQGTAAIARKTKKVKATSHVSASDMTKQAQVAMQLTMMVLKLAAAEEATASTAARK